MGCIGLGIVCVRVFHILCFVHRQVGRATQLRDSTIKVELDSSTESFNPYVAFGSMDKAMLIVFSIAIMAEWPSIVRPI